VSLQFDLDPEHLGLHGVRAQTMTEDRRQLGDIAAQITDVPDDSNYTLPRNSGTVDDTCEILDEFSLGGAASLPPLCTDN
jgi:hypothetical protein